MPVKEGSREALVHAFVVTLLVAVFLFDVFTAAGKAEWVFYLVPLGLTTYQRKSWLPFAVCVAITLFMVIAMLVEPEGLASADLALIRRAYAIIAIWVVGILAFRVIAENNRTRALLWVQRGGSEVTAAMLGEQSVEEVGRNFVGALARYTGAAAGAAFRCEGGKLVPAGGYALDAETGARAIAPGEGLVGEVYRTGKPMRVENLEGGLRVSSATASGKPAHVLAAPITEEGQVVGAVELAFVGASELDRAMQLLDAVGGDAGIALRSALYRHRLQELLYETQQQAEELQAQQEELRVNNEELEEQGRALRESQARLENQHAELEQTNVALEEQTQRLERQKQELLVAQKALSESAATLERVSRYKSEFLANMSHELRTPLNSSLILAKLLADNAAGNLDEEQVRYAKTIQSSNNDLLALINDILDLSKIEAGQVEVNPEPVAIDDVLASMRATFQPIADDKKIALRLERAAGAPQTITTDRQRLSQVLKNLLSNAFKFTAKGEVELSVKAVGADKVAFVVRDTGIGIPVQQQEVIFEAFRQADGTTSRQYGGTGLGLSISRELARLLQGAIRLQSAPGAGSTFTFEIPLAIEARGPMPAAAAHAPPPQPEPARVPAAPAVAPKARVTGPHIEDDRSRREHRGRLILVVEDDQRFAKVLYDLAHELGFDCVHSSTVSEGLELARRLKPSGVLLDVSLPDESGLALLERMKRDPTVRHIPVHMVSVEDHMQAAMGLGAVGYALKPVARDELAKAIGRLEERLKKRVSRVLVVEDDAALRESIAKLLGGESVDIVSVGTVGDALAQLERQSFDCLVTDLALPDASGYELLEKISAGGRHPYLPVIIYTGRALTREEETRLARYSKSIIIKGARSPERLLDEVTLFLHRVEASLPADQQNLLRRVRQRDEAFEGRTILLAEDDVRNIFALSRVLEPLGAQVDIARNGQEAVEHVARGGIDLVLMDIMMPVKDGIAAMREIRAMPDKARLPIIAITAKAMADDRAQCLEAGANDYIAKPIDIDKLVSLCRVWMPR